MGASLISVFTDFTGNNMQLHCSEISAHLLGEVVGEGKLFLFMIFTIQNIVNHTVLYHEICSMATCTCTNLFWVRQILISAFSDSSQYPTIRENKKETW